MKYRLFPNTDVRVSEVGFGTWTLSTGWWGEKTDAEAVAMMRRALDDARRHVLRRRRRVRQRPRRAADRRGVSRAAQRDRDRHEDRLRHLRRRGAEEPARAAGAADAHRSTVHAHGRGEVPRAAGDRLHRRAPDPQREDGARARRGAVGHAARPPARREDQDVGRGVRSGDRLAVRGRGARGARAGHQHHPDDLERARAAPRLGDDRGGASSCAQLLLQHSRHARQRNARGEVHRGHRVPGERSSPPSAAELAGERRGEGEDARLPRAGDDAGAGVAQVAAGGAAGRHDAAEHLRRRTVGRVRGGERPSGS